MVKIRLSKLVNFRLSFRFFPDFGHKWVDLGYFPYEIIHKKWQYHLLKMLKEVAANDEMKSLINELYKKYSQGFVAHITKGKVPEHCRGLAKYLAKYVASPPIAIRRILSYTGNEVTYWYKDHQTKGKEEVTVDVLTFVGRMVQHILPKGFQRIRYYGLQATRPFKKRNEAIKEGLRRIGRIVKGVYEVVQCKGYRERYQGMSGRDPLVCRYCGCEMDLWKVWHPKYGTIYDEWKKIKAGQYERAVESKGSATGGGDIPFGPPPEEYSYRCFHCGCEIWVNEAIIDFELGYAEFEGREMIMPVLGCPGCNGRP